MLQYGEPNCDWQPFPGLAAAIRRPGVFSLDQSFWEYVERARRQTPEQRFLGTLDMINLVHSLNTAGIRHQFPNADEDEVRAILLKRRLRLRQLDRSR